MDARHAAAAKETRLSIDALQKYKANATKYLNAKPSIDVRRRSLQNGICKDLLFQQFLFVQGGNADAILVIVGLVRSHEDIL